MPCAPALLVALLPLWIQATSAAAQVQFSDGWLHGKRSPPTPAALAALLSSLGTEEEAAAPDGRPPGDVQHADMPRRQRAVCAPDQAVIRQVWDVIMREADRVAVCRVKHGVYDVYLTT